MEKITKYLKDKWPELLISGLFVGILLLLVSDYLEDNREKANEVETNKKGDAKLIEANIAEIRGEINEFKIKIENEKKLVELSKGDIEEFAGRLDLSLKKMRGAILRFPFENKGVVRSNNPQIPNNTARIQGQDFSKLILKSINENINGIKESGKSLEKSDGCRDSKSKEEKMIECSLKETMLKKNINMLESDLSRLTDEIDSSVNGLDKSTYICDPFYAEKLCEKP